MPKDRELKSWGAGEGVVWRDRSLYWGLKQEGSGKQRTRRIEKKVAKQWKKRDIEDLEGWRPGRLGKKDQELWEPEAAVQGPVRRIG